MIEPKPRRHVVVPVSVSIVLEEAFPNQKHITGMMSHCVTGQALPPFIILNSLQNLPSELNDLCDSGQIWCGSTSSGYMTKDMFLIWCFHFINWLNEYRTKLPIEIRNKPALLICDGHSSRECPLGLYCLRCNNVIVLVLPSHTSHILQMFDIVLASPLKSKFSKIFEKLIKNIDENQSESMTAKLRLAAIKAFVDAWRSVCTPVMTELAAKKAGIYPLNPNEVKKSEFVSDNLSEEQVRRYNERQQRLEKNINISNKVITTPEIIIGLSSRMEKTERYKYLCDWNGAMKKKYVDVVKEIIKEPHNSAKLLSKMPPYVTQCHYV